MSISAFSTPIDTATIEAPQNDFSPLAPGRYDVMIEEAVSKPTNANDGIYLEIRFVVIGDQYKGRFLWSRLNLNNPNPTAVKIAHEHLKAIGDAIGITKFAPGSELEMANKSLTIKVSVEGDRNNVKGFFPLAARVAAPAPAAPVAAQAEAAETPGDMPW